jgi:hypothetical protein
LGGRGGVQHFSDGSSESSVGNDIEEVEFEVEISNHPNSSLHRAAVGQYTSNAYQNIGVNF